MSFSDKKRLCRLLLPLLCLALLCSCTGTTVGEAPELLEPKGVSMDTVQVEKGAICNIDTYEGLVLPLVHELSFAEGGTVTDVAVCAGSHVKQGDLLARLDVSYVEKQLQSQKDYLSYLEKTEAITERELEIKISLAEQEKSDLRSAGAAASAIQSKDVEIRSLQNTLQETKSLYALDHEALLITVETMEQQVADSYLYAPCDGTVVTCNAKDGGYALENMSVIWLAEDSEMLISTDYISTAVLTAADRIYATVGGQQVEIAHQNMDRAEYLSKSSSGSKVSSSFTITDAKGSTVENGMSAVVFVISDTVEDALIVPTAAVRNDGNTYYVYAIVDGMQVRRNIRRGICNDALVQILEGVEEGDVVYAGA